MMTRFLLSLMPLLLLAAPARADDVSVAGRSVVRVVVVVSEAEEILDFAHGSGFAIGRNRIVTNAHVVEGMRQHPDNATIGIVPSSGARSFEARLVTIDPARDLALLEIVDGALPPVPLYMGPLADGTTVAALGYPGNVDLATVGSWRDFISPTPPIRSGGNISNERRIAGTAALLHTASIARGHSGGPLVDACGRVVGVNTFITRADEGDSPFAFAIHNRELAAFLRGAGQSFATVASECVSMADRLRDERDREEREAMERGAAEREARLRADQGALARAMAANQDARENRTAIALLVAMLGIVGLAGGGVMLAKDRQRPAYVLAGGGLVLLLGATVLFLTRPSRAELLETPAPPASPAGRTAAAGEHLCRIVPDRSRITVSSAEEVGLAWSDGGCVNGRTQYARDGDGWTRILVPGEEATVSTHRFEPAASEYVVTRYRLDGEAMERARALRARTAIRGCTSDEAALAQLSAQQDELRAILPRLPNERLVYRCARSGAQGSSTIMSTSGTAS